MNRKFSCQIFTVVQYLRSEVEFSKTSLASRTRFGVLVLGHKVQVLGIGLEASRPRELPCPQLEDSAIFCNVGILLENARNLAENWQRPFLFSAIGDRQKIF